MKAVFLFLVFLLCSCQMHNKLGQNALIYSEIAFSYEKAGQVEKASEYYQKSIEVSPNLGEVHNNYGAFLCRQGKYKKSLEEFKKAINSTNYADKQAAVENARWCGEVKKHSPV